MVSCLTSWLDRLSLSIIFRTQLYCDLECGDASNTGRQGRHAVRHKKDESEVRQIVNVLVDTKSLFMYVANHMSIVCGQRNFDVAI